MNVVDLINEFAEKLGFEEVIYSETLPANIEIEKKTLFVNTIFEGYKEHKPDIVEIPESFNAIGNVYNSYPDRPGMLVKSRNEYECWIDIKTGSILIVLKTENPQRVKKDLEMLERYLGEPEYFISTNFARKLLEYKIHVEIPGEEELINRIRYLFNSYYKKEIETKIFIESAKQTAELRAKVAELERQLERLQRLEKNIDRIVGDKVANILTLLGNGWKLTKINDKLWLVYPEIIPDRININGETYELYEGHRYYIKNLLVPIDDHVYDVYTTNAKHINVSPESSSLGGKTVYKVCLGKLEGQDFLTVAQSIVPTLKVMNYDSAYHNHIDSKLEEFVDKITKEQAAKTDWEV